jgi:uncharacterized protein YfdQ (DUF2303 family)
MITEFKDVPDATAIIDAVERLACVEHATVIDPNDKDAQGVPFAIVPSGKKIESLKRILDEYRTKPERRSGTATLTTQASFVDHVKRFAGDASVIFADRTPASPSLLAVYDYNPAGPENDAAAFGRHRAVYSFPLSDEWKAWTSADESEMDAAKFAAFLEDRLQDVRVVDTDTEAEDSPILAIAMLFQGRYATPNQLLNLSRSLDINASVAVRQALRLETGEIDVRFVETHSDGEGKPITIPNLFVISIPVFRDGERFRMVCRLRYRLANTHVTWWYTMVQPERYLDTAIVEVVEAVQKATERPVMFGAPER